MREVPQKCETLSFSLQRRTLGGGFSHLMYARLPVLLASSVARLGQGPWTGEREKGEAHNCVRLVVSNNNHKTVDCQIFISKHRTIVHFQFLLSKQILI